MKKHNIIPPYHHGARKHHSTITATQVIQHQLQSNRDKQLDSAVLLTDLGSAFDTCNHQLLKSKMAHIGIRGKALEVFGSFLENRKFFVEIQDYRSKKFDLEGKSVIQGSRLASDFYTIYTLDIGKLNIVLQNQDLYRTLTNEQIPEIPTNSQENVTFVDDLSQVVGINNRLELQMFIQILYELTVRYFSTNMLSINCTKTEVLTVPYKSEDDDELVIMTSEGEFIKAKHEVKILGIYFNSSNDMSNHISKTASRVGLAYKNLLPYIKYSSLHQRKILIKSKIESIALYGSPLMFNQSDHIQKRFLAIRMRINKWILRENFSKRKTRKFVQRSRRMNLIKSTSRLMYFTSLN